ncbi:MAG: ABC transporter ATP-binding protein, partial [Kiloniellales bacterium]
MLHQQKIFGPPILKAEGISLAFGGVKALSEVSFEIREHEILAIIGPNGAGKSSMLNVINGFYHPQEGTITYKGKARQQMRPHEAAKTGIARTFQNIRLFNNMTVIENIMVGQEAHLKSSWLGAIFGTPGAQKENAESEAEGRRLLRFVGLQGKGDSLARNLPYGDQRRLEIARALASKPRLILLDEPTAGMNPSE